MKFNAYFVELKHRENIFTAGLIIDDKPISANFRNIGKDIYMVNFKTQVELTFMEKTVIKQKNKEAVVLLPVLSKYNKRRLLRISRFLEDETPGARDVKTILLNLLSVEKFLKVQELISFFRIDREELIDFLIEKEMERVIKVIDFTCLSITSYENLKEYYDELKGILKEYYDSGVKSVKFTDIEAKLKLPQSSLLFKYLLQSSRLEFPCKIQKDKVILQKATLSEEEKGSLTEIENTLKKHKISIFTLENILSNSNLLQKEVNDSLWFLIDNGQVTQLTEKYYIFQEELNKILNKLRKYKRNQGEMIDIQAFRELTTLTRKYIIILFEYFDSQRITERIENKRKILIPT